MAMTRFLQLSGRLAMAAGVMLLATVAFAQDELDSLDAAGDSSMQQGFNALESEEYEAARDAFTDALAASPGNVEALIGRARAFAGLEQPQAAITDFTQAWTYTSSSTEQAKLLRAKTQFYRGKMYLDLGNQYAGTALPDLQAAYDADRENLLYSFQLGKAYSLAGGPQQAEPLLTAYLEEYPDDAEALRLRGTSFASMRKKDEALADLNRAVELAPDDHENYVSLATVYMVNEEYEPAANALEKAIEKFVPEEDQEEIPFSQGYLTLAMVYEEMGKNATDTEKAQADYQKSIATCDKLLGMFPDDPGYDQQRAATYFRKGVGHRLLQEYGKAVEALTEAVDRNPELAEAYYRRAICFAEMGENKLALRDLTDTETLSFGDARPYLWEGIVYAQMGEYREAIRSYNKAIALSNRYSDAYLNRAHAYFQLGEYEAAIDSFNECIRLHPAAAEYYYKRGLCYHNMKQLGEAVQSYINAIQFDEDYAPAYDQLIPALEQEGRIDLANRYREKRASIAE